MKTLFLILLLLPLGGSAFEIRVLKNGSRADVNVSGILIPTDELDKSIKSGLSTVLVGTLNVWKKGQLLARTIVNMKVYYDLWDEAFYLQKTAESKTSTEKVLKKTDVFSLLSSCSFVSAFPLDLLQNESELYISFGLIIDPITKDKRQKIRKWLAQNNVTTPSSRASLPDSNPTVAIPPTGSIGRGLFNQLLDSEISSDIDSAKWSFISPKQSISMKDVVREK